MSRTSDHANSYRQSRILLDVPIPNACRRFAMTRLNVSLWLGPTCTRFTFPQLSARGAAVTFATWIDDPPGPDSTQPDWDSTSAQWLSLLHNETYLASICSGVLPSLVAVPMALPSRRNPLNCEREFSSASWGYPTV